MIAVHDDIDASTFIKKIGEIKLHKIINFQLDWEYKVKLATFFEGDPKAPFSIATTPRGRGGRYSISWIAPWSLPYSSEW